MEMMNDSIITNYMPTPPPKDEPWPITAMSPRYIKPFTASSPPLFSDWAIATNAHGHSDKHMPSLPTFLPASWLRYSLRGGRPVCLGAGSFGEVYVISLKGAEKPVHVKVFTEQSRETDHSILVEAAKLMAITGFDAEACWPLNGPLFSPLNPLYSFVGVGVTGLPLSTNWSGRVLQAITSVMALNDSLVLWSRQPDHDPSGLSVRPWEATSETWSLTRQPSPRLWLPSCSTSTSVALPLTTSRKIVWCYAGVKKCGTMWDLVVIDVGQTCYLDQHVCYRNGFLPYEVKKGPQELPPAHPQLLQKDFCCEKSDVYSLGRVFCRIGHVCGSQNLWMVGHVCRVPWLRGHAGPGHRVTLSAAGPGFSWWMNREHTDL